MPRIVFDEERCKGCGLCIDACPQGIVVLAEHLNRQGFHPATVKERERCQGCALCAVMCPDMVIEVTKGDGDGKSINEG
ncbi:MAG: 2-oxoglutarate ferredoxin oxidoreductase subunit delta [Eubacteriales bacterium]|nr:2-oxoglutarate ferredoxin oxidoreductase subunit delta [Eubacteriales bacterium]